MNMFYNLNLKNLIYMDIETVMITKDLEDAPERIRGLWEKKNKHVEPLISGKERKDYLCDLWKQKASLYPEFAKIVCISVGGYGENGFHVKDYREGISHEGSIIENEIGIIQAFNSVLDNPKYSNMTPIAHNGKNFDYPFLIKRSLINGIIPNKFLWIYGKKPWEVNLLDSQEIWAFGSYGSRTSLDTIAASLGLPSPKKDMDGSEVWKYYYEMENGGKEAIGKYCNNDVISLAQVMLSIVGDDDLEQPEFIG